MFEVIVSKSKKDFSKQILSYNFHVKKSLGQCFLSDSNIPQKIVELSNLNHDTTVIEVGAGMGALTKYLLPQSKKVIAYEIDPSIIPILKENTKAYSNLEIQEEDILKANLAYLSSIEGPIISISNLPYYITSPIISLFLEKIPEIKTMYFMVQKEVADRITAKKNTKDYNAFSVEIQYLSKVKSILFVPRNCFTPAPNVDSAVIKIEKIERNNSIEDYTAFKKVVERCFRERRKTLLNNLSINQSKEDVRRILESANIDSSLRAEDLSIEDFINLYNVFGGKI